MNDAMPKPKQDKRTYLVRHKRASGEVRFVMTTRDVAILEALNRYRFMRTSQIRKLVFTNNESLQSCQRRLKYLYHNYFIGRIIPLIQIGQGIGESAYYLEKKGVEVLEEQDIEKCDYPPPSKVKYMFLNHALDVAQFRVDLEVALRDHPKAELHRFIADYEIKSHTEKALSKRRYKLFDEVTHPVSKEPYVVYPDSLLILKGKGELSKFQRLFFLEIDRGTESLGVIKDKVTGYNLYKKQDIYKKFGAFDNFTVLFQTNSSKRAEHITRLLLDIENSENIWVTDVGKVTEKTILSSVWLNGKMEQKAIVKQ